MKYYSRKNSLVKERIANEEVRERLEKIISDLDYIAMLTDVDLGEVEENEEYSTENGREEN
ncbi:MAG: hypothetical protein MJ102_02030 [Clostridia bacterium]|nr:hypothetical protein [Clostridia bacterium]